VFPGGIFGCVESDTDAGNLRGYKRSRFEKFSHFDVVNIVLFERGTDAGNLSCSGDRRMRFTVLLR